MVNCKEKAASIKGPVFPILTAFDESGDVDFLSIEKYVEFLISSGCKNLMVTVGTSRFNLLTEQEMLDVNSCVVHAAAGKAFTIVTTGPLGSERSAIKFARHAEDIGADAILGVYPERYYGDDAIAGFFENICKSTSVGVMVHMAQMNSGAARFPATLPYSVDLLERLCEQENFVGMKEESNSPALIYEYNRRLKDKMTIIGGAGGMRAYLTAWNWGQPAYLVGIGNFLPQIEIDFYKHLCSGNIEAAKEIVFNYEGPFFSEAIKAGWHPALKEALDYMGLMSACEREPLQRLEGDARERVRSVISGEGYAV
ncbi:4-hydroxy-tetrahydrodipicolinate synthase [Maridesulfovibrio ferrireducens]|uniref:4-hydroxy-tetrahydrodipicolinate synthase n=1 Tax=Maridesulfovibrio ferrireducens TaxID=246191 RepID=A0A1G9ERQ5_9BACT|nr:dihydrodipicolinate synthase family protein [Maridesulfovibrio ferrireducens]SDK78872.1 4-hydroxy-tetrahydrodipicolinate synthase [Maridesulfovibrio ferrireducens]